MSKTRPIHYISTIVFLICLLLVLAQGSASQTVPLPDQATASYHPGLFGNLASEQVPVPPVVNTYSGAEDKILHNPGAINFSFFPGDREKGEKPSVAGYITGTLINTSVNISGRADNAEQYRYLVTIKPDIRGIFVWSLPEWASNITMVRVEITR